MAPETFDSLGQKISVKVFKPTAAGKHPAIVVAYGTRGLEAEFGKAITTFAENLAAAGYLALIPDYFQSTHTPPSDDPQGDLRVSSAFIGFHDSWIETLGDCLTAAAGRTEAAADRVGLLGFSMGGNLALRLAKLATGVKVPAVVDFFAPIGMLGGIGGDIAKLPPVQIHHGKDDGKDGKGVPPQESLDLIEQLKKAGKVEGRDYEFHPYPGQGHGFTGDAATKSTQRTVDFFDRHLK